MLSACKKGKGPEYGTVIDGCGKSYPTVKIGDQYWMAENMACINYADESEAYKAGVYQISTSEEYVYEPYYTDGRQVEGQYTENLYQEQRSQLGLLYNWAAAMGYKNKEEALSQTGDYSGKRQGICPNKWHIPSAVEWDKMLQFIADTYDNGEKGREGVHLKSSLGWYGRNRDYIGDNASGFSALPAGYASGSSVIHIGYRTDFWLSDSSSSENARDRGMFSDSSRGDGTSSYKYFGLSVRCVKD